MRWKVFILTGVMAAALLSGCATSATNHREEQAVVKQWSKTYKEGLQYELFFRHLSRRGFAQFGSDSDDEFHQEAWGLWNKMELHAMQVMAPLRARNRVDLTPGWKVKTASRFFTLALKVMPGVTFKEVEVSAKNFIPQLQAIKATAAAGDQDLMDFMIAHELALVHFLEFYNAGDRTQAMAVFKTRAQQYFAKDESTPLKNSI